MKKTLLSLIAIIGVVIVSDSLYNKAFTWANEGPPGYTGSPGDGQTCAQGCHNTSDLTVAQFTTDIPETGYIPGQTYTIGFGGTTGLHSKYGFQASPQDNAGNLVGSIAAGTGSKIVGAKYATHDGAFNGSVAAWSFAWTAPSSGTGDVTFYGAMIAANGNGSPGGDQGLKTTYTVSEDISTSLENSDKQLSVFVYPTLIETSLNIDNGEGKEYQILDINGKLIMSGNVQTKKKTIQVSSLSAGVYFLYIDGNITKLIKK